MSFNFLVNYWTTADENGSMTWNVTHDKISILHHFNDENIDLEQMLSLLNNSDETYGLQTRGQKLWFVMQVSNSEHWNYDYFKRVEFTVKRFFFFLIFSSINLETMNFKEFFVRYENVLAFYSFLKMKSKQIIRNGQEKN